MLNRFAASLFLTAVLGAMAAGAAPVFSDAEPLPPSGLNRELPIAPIVSPLTLLSEPSEADVCDSCVCCDSPVSRWTARVDALWLKPSFGKTVLVQSGLFPGGAVTDTLAINGSNLQAGARLQLIFQVDDEISVEGIYFGFQQWSSGGAITPDPFGIGSTVVSNFLQTPNLIGGLDGTTNYNYGANLNNVEFNRRRLVSDNDWQVSRLVGFRYLQWNDSMNLTGTDPSFVPNIVETVNARAANHLIGSQVGLGLQRDWNRLQLNVDGKAGLFLNLIDQQRSNLYSTGVNGGFPAITPFNETNHTSGIAGVLDFSANATYHVSSNFSIRGGYQLLYIPGLALAPGQLTGFSHNGDPFLHGPSAGFELRR